jgi:hypothetical protein
VCVRLKLKLRLQGRTKIAHHNVVHGSPQIVHRKRAQRASLAFFS